jgi:hypothetical protein
MTDRTDGNVPEFTLTVSVPGVWGPQVLTSAELAAELRRVAAQLDEGESYEPDFSGEWHYVHARGAVVSHAYWQGGNPYTSDMVHPAEQRPGYPEAAWRPWLEAGPRPDEAESEEDYFEVTPRDWAGEDE